MIENINEKQMELLSKDVKNIVYKYLFMSNYDKVVTQFKSFFLEEKLHKARGINKKKYSNGGEQSIWCMQCDHYILVSSYLFAYNLGCDDSIKRHFKIKNCM